MELDELKSLWQRHDSQLENNLKLNEQILRQLKLNRTGNEFRRLMNFEIASVVAGSPAVLAVAYLAGISRLPLYAALGYASGGIMLMYLVFSMLRLSGFSKLCGYNESIVKVQKELASQKRRMLRFRKIEFITMPVCFMTCIPFLSEVIYGFDMLQYPGRYAAGVAVSCTITVPLMVWLYRVFYDKRIASAEALLKSVADFENPTE
jgi:hypothetical protein